MSYSRVNWRRLDQFRSGSRQYFEEYYKQYCLRIYYYLYELTGDIHAAQDTTQRVFVTFFTDRAKVNNESHILPFLYRIAQNFAHEYLREHGRLEEMKAEFAYIADGQTGVVDATSAEKTKAEILNELYEALQVLPPRKREVIHLYFWCGMSVNDIAARLSIAPQTVRNLLYQSLVLLRRNLAGNWEHFILYFS